MGPSALRVANIAAGLRRLGYEVGREVDIQVPSMESRAYKEISNMRFKEEILDVCGRLCARVERILNDGDFPLIYGGDHSLAMGSVSGISNHLAQEDKKLGLIWFDAHADMNTAESSPSGNIHGMPLSALLGMGDPDLCSIGGPQTKVDANNVALVAIRDIDDGERSAIQESGVHAFTMRDIDEQGMAAVAKKVLEIVNNGTDGFHLSFDVDGLDPEIAPGTGTRVKGGVDFREAHLFMENLADDGRLTSMDVVELNPSLDIKNQTAGIVKELVLSAFGKSVL
jgi:arginase